MFRFIVHNTLHFLAPGIIAWFFFKKEWKKSWIIMLMTMIIDIDHLLARPVFDPTRCSIGFHPLHSYYVMPIYILFLFSKKLRIIGVGLLFHLLTDYLDCLWINA